MVEQLTAYEQLPDTTRMWIYQSNRPLTAAENNDIRQKLRQFASKWVSHNRALRAWGDVFHDRFVVLMVDESQADASGCSIDKSVYFLKELQATYGIDLFDRMRFSYEDAEGKVHTVDRDAFVRAYQDGDIDDQTLVFDTLVENKGHFQSAFRKPLKDSWHARLV